MFRFELLATCPQTGARRGRVHTHHGSFETPAFMPVGTQGGLKGLTPRQVRETGASCVLANTYHLMLRPGADVVQAVGGLQIFSGWRGPMLTDSGGFQVFSLAHRSKVDDDGVTFQSHLDGQTVRLTPEISIDVQNKLGADIIMAFDECPPSTAERGVQERAVARTLAWARRCAAAHDNDRQALFGIVQGGLDENLRKQCAAELVALDLPGYAVGGLAVGEGHAEMCRILSATTPELPENRPRYLMGVGYPRDLAAAVARGVDLFDCVLPTRNGRGVAAFTAAGVVKLRYAKYRASPDPIEIGCDCYACQTYTRAALRHYWYAKEMLGPIAVSLHNLRFYQRLMADLRRAVEEGRSGDFLAADPRCRVGPAGETPAEPPDAAEKVTPPEKSV